MRFFSIVAALFFVSFYQLSSVRADEAGWLGVTVETVTPAMMVEKALSVPFGARIDKIENDSPAIDAGILVGDVIVSFNGIAILDAPSLASEILKIAPGVSVSLTRVRNNETEVVTIVADAPNSQAFAPLTGPPLFQLDTGGHTSTVSALTFTSDGRQLVSAGYDKVVRIWNVKTGQTERVIRGSSGVGSEGDIYAIALSPDGSILAVGGSLPAKNDAIAGSIRLYDFATGRLEKPGGLTCVF